MVRYVLNAVDPDGRDRLWATDGTVGDTAKVSGVPTDVQFFSRTGLFVTPTTFASLGNGYAVFGATDSAVDTELWVTDGTPAGTALVKDIVPGTVSSFPRGFASLRNGRAVFAALADGSGSSAAGTQLWVTDGTAGGTYALTAFPAGTISAAPTYLGNGRAVFAASDGLGTGVEPWVTDGTAAGTYLLKDVYPGKSPSGYANSSYPTGFTAFGDGRAVFAANDGSAGQGGGAGLWVTDGTPGGTTPLHGAFPGTSNSPTAFSPLGDGRIVFAADDGSTGREPWITDGTPAGTHLVKDLYPGSGSYGPNGSLVGSDGFAPLGGGRAVFAANDGVAGRELWVTDGTADGTRLVEDIYPGRTASGTPNSSNPSGFAALGNGRALFAATDGGSATGELWTTDGTAAGTAALKTLMPYDIVPAPGGKALFGASVAGAPFGQLWATDGTSGGTSRLASFSGGANGASSPNNITGLQFLRGAAGPDPLFDPVFYLTRNPDVAAAGLDPLQHYMQSGYREGRNPDAYFDTQYYLDHNPDVAAAAANGLNPLLHYEQNGWREGRNPSAQFDIRQYLVANQDVAGAGVGPLRHYLADGRVEGRLAYAVFDGATDPLVDASYYYAASPDVRAAGLDAVQHYHTWGWHERRNPDAYFDTTYYLSRNADVAASGLDPLLHYDRFGWKEGRDPSAQFSTGKYLAAYSDVQAAGVDPLLHYLRYGQAEGRQAFPA